jgi:hypothetical protein
MNDRRRLLASASAAGALLALTACETPAPIVTVVSGGESVYTEANTWCFEGQTPPDCAERAEGVAELSVRGGETVGVDVDGEVADRGWYLELSEPEGQGQGSQPQRSEVQTGHYFTFTAPNLPSGSELLLTVHGVGEGEQQEPTGTWQFVLTPRR